MSKKYATRLVLGLFLGFAVFYIKSFVESHSLIEKTQSHHGLYYSFDLLYYGFLFIGFSLSILLIVPSIVYFIRKIIMKTKSRR